MIMNKKYTKGRVLPVPPFFLARSNETGSKCPGRIVVYRSSPTTLLRTLLSPWLEVPRMVEIKQAFFLYQVPCVI